uniref:NADH-ubiquinone oxidoreductase chain 4 n=1 Tax=Wellcomia siamensis TaxID=435744 RepID=G4V258_WELSI|nr:NADH dehydrogenase subunit 4 [Wellcomia siamensis]ACV96775.1 NADH dehydrogenase subunit 4 [Wellcomia siamensis]
MFFVWKFIFFFSSVLFCYFLVFFLFLGLNDYCWSGFFIFFDSYVYILLVFMSLFILGLILMSEYNYVLVFLSEILVLICLFFFFSLNMMMLYIFFELSLFPMLIMILGYGFQIEKISAFYYLGFYTFLCSSPFLYVYFCSNFFLFYAYYDVVVSYEMLLFLTFCFLVKIPVYFFHLWLPKAHVEAPTVASMLLAGLMLKLGTVGVLRLLSSYNNIFIYCWEIFALLGMVFCSFFCLLQSDVKSLVAYSSIVHMGFVFLVLILIFLSSKVSAIIMMVSHGYLSVLMFYFVGGFYHVVGTRILSYLGGFMVSSLLLSCLMMLVFLCNSGLPPSLSFFSEFLGIVSIYMCCFGLFFFLFLYFFVSFYYSLYVLTISLMGKKMVNFFVWYSGVSVFGLLLVFDFFWMGILF